MDRLGLLCRNIYENNKMTQRELAAAMDISLGTCNHLVKEGLDQELFSFDPVDGSYSLLKGGVDLLRNYRMDSAVILAAGFGSRFVPLTFETPKGLLEVYGERMIERQIKQLHEAGVTDITIVVGYLKENTYTITSFTFCILTCSVFKIFYDTECIRYCLMCLYSFDADNCTDTTVIMLKLWVIKSRLFILIFHSPIILSYII